MKLEEAIKELKNIWKETSFENSQRRIAIETVLQALKDKDKEIEKSNKIGFEEGRRSLKLEARYNNLKEDSIPKKKIEDKKKQIDYRTANGEERYYQKAILQELLEEK